MLVERDATSSGVQICAALTRNESMAKSVNLIPSAEKQDIYEIVAGQANAEFSKLKLDWTLERDDVKKASIAVVYGGTHKTAYEELQESISKRFDDEPKGFQAFWGVLSQTMAGVMQVEKYVGSMLRELSSADIHRIEFPLPSGGVAVFNTEHSKDAITGSTHIVKARTKAEAKEQTKKAEEWNKDKVAADSYAATYFTWMPVGGKRFPTKSVTAALVQGFDAAILATAQLKLIERGIVAHCKHDAFLIDIEHEAVLLSVFRETMIELFSGRPLDDLADQLEARYEVEMPRFGEMFGYGQFCPSDMKHARHLIAE